MLQGQVQNLGVVIYDESGRTMQDQPVTFTVSSAFATVNSSGVFTAVGPGQTTLTVASGAANIAVPVAITGHPAGVAGPRLTLDSRPFGVAVGPDSVLLATQLDAATMGGPRELASFAGVHPRRISSDVGGDSTGRYRLRRQSASGNIGIVRLATGVQTGAIGTGDLFRVNMGYGRSSRCATATASLPSTRIPSPSTGVSRWALIRMAWRSWTDGTALYVTNMSSGTLSEVVLAGSPWPDIHPGGVSQDGSSHPITLSSAANRRGLSVIDLATGNDGWRHRHRESPAWHSPVAGLVASRPGKSGQVVLIDRASRQVLNTVETGVCRAGSRWTSPGHRGRANESGWVDLIRQGTNFPPYACSGGTHNYPRREEFGWRLCGPPRARLRRSRR